jgi:hypothetical protein
MIITVQTSFYSPRPLTINPLFYNNVIPSGLVRRGVGVITFDQLGWLSCEKIIMIQNIISFAAPIHDKSVVLQ